MLDYIININDSFRSNTVSVYENEDIKSNKFNEMRNGIGKNVSNDVFIALNLDKIFNIDFIYKD